MSETPTMGGPTLDRRKTILWAGAVAAALAAGGGYAALEFGHVLGGGAKGYGTDPNLVSPKTPWPRILNKDQLLALTAFSDFILPAEGTAPSASAIGVHEFLDEWVSAPYPDQQADRKLILTGLDTLDRDAKAVAGGSFTAATPAVQKTVLEALARSNDPAKAAFFAKVRRLVIGAYYTTEAGFKDIGYIGNQSLDAYPGASAEVKAAIEAAANKLKLA